MSNIRRKPTPVPSIPTAPCLHRFDEREAKLPQWAQHLISVLRRDLAEAIKERNTWTSGDGEGPFFLRDHDVRPAVDRAIPARSIRFKHGEIELDLREENGKLAVYGHGDRHTLAVSPHSGNVVAVWQPGDDD